MNSQINNTSDPFQELVVAYALEALEPGEVAAVEGHLSSCESCRADLESMRAAATALAWDLEPVAPPLGHRDRFMEKLDAVGPALEPTGHRQRFREKMAATIASSTKAAPWWRTLNPLAGWGLAGALAALLLLVGLWGLDQSRLADDTNRQFVASEHRASDAESQLAASRQQADASLRQAHDAQATAQTLQQQRDTLLAVVNSPASKSAALTGLGSFGSARVRVWLDPQTNKVVMAATDLPPPPPGKVYELWLIAGKTPVPLNVFQATVGQQALLTFDAPPSTSGYSLAAITVENSRVLAPTSTPILVGSF